MAESDTNWLKKFCKLPRIIKCVHSWRSHKYEAILGNPGVIHSVPTAFIIHDECSGYGMDHHECSGYGMDHVWVTEDGMEQTRRSRGSKDRYGIRTTLIKKKSKYLLEVPIQ